MQRVTAMHKTICNVYILLVLAWETIVLLVLDGSMPGPVQQMKYYSLVVLLYVINVKL